MGRCEGGRATPSVTGMETHPSAVPWSRRGTATAWSDQIVTVVIAAVSAFFGVALTQGARLMRDLLGGDPSAGMISAAALFVAWVFIGIGSYTAAVVTANAFATLVAGRVRTIALLRLLGARASRLRRDLAREGLAAGAAGSMVGLAIALIGYRAAVGAAVAAGALPAIAYTWVDPGVVAPTLVAVVTVGVSAYAGSRVVGQVAPIQALSADIEAPIEQVRMGRRARAGIAALVVVGVVLLAGGVAIGLRFPGGVLVAFWGGVASFTGVVAGGVFIVPRLMRWVSTAFGRSVPATLARDYATRSPRAATRGAIGMVVGVALIVMFVVALATMRDITHGALVNDPARPPSAEDLQMYDRMIGITTAVMVALTAISAVLAAIGMIANLALSVLRRRRDLGLLRAVGATGGQVRAMIVLEALLTSVVSIGFGAVLGVLYGWAGAQSTFGVVAGGLVAPVVPWPLIGTILVAAAGLALAASAGPALRASRISPTRALEVT